MSRYSFFVEFVGQQAGRGVLGGHDQQLRTGNVHGGHEAPGLVRIRRRDRIELRGVERTRQCLGRGLGPGILPASYCGRNRDGKQQAGGGGQQRPARGPAGRGVHGSDLEKGVCMWPLVPCSRGLRKGSTDKERILLVNMASLPGRQAAESAQRAERRPDGGHDRDALPRRRDDRRLDDCRCFPGPPRQVGDEPIELLRLGGREGRPSARRPRPSPLPAR